MNDAHFLRILSSTPVDHSRSWRVSALCERSKHRCCLLIITLPLVAVVPDTDTMLFSFLLLFIWDAAFRIIVVMRLYADANSSNGMEFLTYPLLGPHFSTAPLPSRYDDHSHLGVLDALLMRIRKRIKKQQHWNEARVGRKSKQRERKKTQTTSIFIQFANGAHPFYSMFSLQHFSSVLPDRFYLFFSQTRHPCALVCSRFPSTHHHHHLESERKKEREHYFFACSAADNRKHSSMCLLAGAS